MPSPVGHSLMGYLVYRVTARSVGGAGWPFMFLCLLVANLPDLDFVPGFLIGDPNRYHHGISHSVGFAALSAFAYSSLLALRKRYAASRNFLIFFSLYFSHLLLDYLSIDNGASKGIPLLWPLSDEYYIAPFAFLPDIWRGSSSSLLGFVLGLFSTHNLWAMTVEFSLLFPLILLMLVLRRKRPISTG